MLRSGGVLGNDLATRQPATAACRGSQRVAGPRDASASVRTAASLEPAAGWTAIAADLDGDGRPDPATPDDAAGVIRVWLSRGG